MGGHSDIMMMNSYNWKGDYRSDDDVKQPKNASKPIPNASESYEYVGKWKILFGKHKNTIYDDVPVTYLKWCDENNIINNEKVKGYIKERLSEKLI